MIKRPAQHTALTFLRLSKLSVAFLLVMIILYPILMLLGIGIKVGIVLGIHFLVELLFGSWIVLYVFSILTFIFLAFSFLSRVKELGRYYIGLGRTRLSTARKLWYKVVFAIDFLVTDMLTLTASFILAYVYWMSAVMHSYAPFYVYLQPFIALSILGGLLQILFSSYYLTHDSLHAVYVNAIGAGRTYDQVTSPSRTRPAQPKRLKRSSKKKSSRKITDDQASLAAQNQCVIIKDHFERVMKWREINERSQRRNPQSINPHVKKAAVRNHRADGAKPFFSFSVNSLTEPGFNNPKETDPMLALFRLVT